MMCYSTEPKDRLFVKGYGFLSVTKNIAKNLGKKIIKTLSGKYDENFLITLKHLQDMQLKLL